MASAARVSGLGLRAFPWPSCSVRGVTVEANGQMVPRTQALYEFLAERLHASALQLQCSYDADSPTRTTAGSHEDDDGHWTYSLANPPESSLRCTQAPTVDDAI